MQILLGCFLCGDHRRLVCEIALLVSKAQGADFIPRPVSILAAMDQGFLLRHAVHVNATSTRSRQFSAVGVGEKSSMSVVVGMENAGNQRLGL